MVKRYLLRGCARFVLSYTDFRRKRPAKDELVLITLRNEAKTQLVARYDGEYWFIVCQGCALTTGRYGGNAVLAWAKLPSFKTWPSHDCHDIATEEDYGKRPE